MSEISLVMPCYNSGKYIMETIESVLIQSFSDFEFIIVDDGSTDNTKEIVLSFSDKRIKYLYQENQGVGSALRLGCSIATGKYIARIDADDICMYNRLEKEYNYLEKHRYCVLVSSAVIYIDAEGKKLGRSFPYLFHYQLKRNFKYGNAIAHPAVMFRKDIYEKSGGYPLLKNSQDYFLWQKMIKYGRLRNLRIPLIKYRILSTSISRIVESNKDYRIMLMFLIQKMIKEDSFSEEDINLYNTIHGLLKKDIQPSFTANIYVKSIEEKMYSYARKILGENIAIHIVYYIKNIYGLLK